MRSSSLALGGHTCPGLQQPEPSQGTKKGKKCFPLLAADIIAAYFSERMWSLGQDVGGGLCPVVTMGVQRPATVWIIASVEGNRQPGLVETQRMGV